MPKYIFHWKDKTTNEGEGKDVVDAFTHLEFGAGAMGSSLDYYEEVKTSAKETNVTLNYDDLVELANHWDQFREVFGASDEDLPELSVETLDALNLLEFNKRRDYSREHNDNQKVGKEKK